MIVFCNTTPIIALASIDQLDLLPRLFGKIHVADAVINECTAGGLLKARQQALVPSFRKAAQAMRRQGIYYSPALIERLARTVGE